MKSLKGFNGEIVFYKDIKYGFINCMAVDVGESVNDEWVELKRISVDIEFTDDTTSLEIAALEKSIENKKRDFNEFVKNTNDKIQSLRAIEHNP